MNNTSKLQNFYTQLKEITSLKQVEGLLDWDQQVNLPVLGGDARAAQLELVATLIHKRVTDEALFELCEELHSDIQSLETEDAVNVRETKRALTKQRKLPESFVAAKTRAIAKCYQVWTKAKPTNDFKSALPYLSEIVNLSIEETKLIGFTEHPYDALLDTYEPYAKLSEIKPLLLSVGESISAVLPDMVKKSLSRKSAVSPALPRALQEVLCKKIAEDIGYSFDSGRIDTAPHPFQTTLGPQDARITTRWDETNFLSSLYGVIHEVGHALYELGFRPEYEGTPMGQPVSLGIHESQSRFWENIVGRSDAFSHYLNRTLTAVTPSGTAKGTPKDLWYLANQVLPTPIRVEADEVTYTLHIVIRMLLEEALITGDLVTADLPGAWNELYNKYLHITPSDDTHGVLQDIHWYSGSIGYFPTYALGNLYGAQMYEKMRIDLPSFDTDVTEGKFARILTWLRSNVHSYGMRYPGPALIEHITGNPLSAEPFLNYLKNKFTLV